MKYQDEGGFAPTMKLAEKNNEYANEAVQEWMKTSPIKSITADNRSKSALLRQLKNVKAYFAHPCSFHEKGNYEHFNYLLRELVPKGLSL